MSPGATPRSLPPIPGYTGNPASLLDDVAETGGRTLGNRFAAGRAAASTARSTLPGWLGQGGWKRGVGTAATAYGAGAVADRLFDEEDESIAGQFGEGFTRGAGWAPLAAPVIAAIPGVNLVGLPLLAAGAAASGIVGGVLDVLDAGDWFGGGSDKPKPPEFRQAVSALWQTFNQFAPNDPAAREYFGAQLEYGKHQIESTPDDQLVVADPADPTKQVKLSREEALASLAQSVGSQMDQYIQQKMQQKLTMGEAPTAAQRATNQSMYAAVLEPYAAMEEQAGAAQGQLFIDKGNEIGGEAGAQLKFQGEIQKSNSQRLASAYRAQAQILPAMNNLDQYNAQLQQAAQQQQYQDPTATDPATDAALEQIMGATG